MAVFHDALDLKTAVGDHIGNRQISDVWPRLVQQAENSLNQQLRTRHQVNDYTMTFDAGLAPLPPDFLEIFRVSRSCFPADYEIDGFNMRVLGYTGDADIQYYAALPSLSRSLSSCNWLLEKYPSVYLYAVSLEAAKFLKDVELSTATDQLLGYALSSLRIDDERSRYSVAGTRVRGLTP